MSSLCTGFYRGARPLGRPTKVVDRPCGWPNFCPLFSEMLNDSTYSKNTWMHTGVGRCRPRSGPKWTWTWKSTKFMHALDSKQIWLPFSLQNALRLLVQIHILWGMKMQKLRNQICQGFQCKKAQRSCKNSNWKPSKCNGWKQIWDNYRFTYRQGFKILSPLNQTFSSSVIFKFERFIQSMTED